MTFSDLHREFFCWVENHPSTSTLLTFSVTVCKRPRSSGFNLWFQVRFGVWYWKLDLLQVTWSPKDSQLPCSICYYISVFFPPASVIHHHMRFNVFLQTMFVESCLLLLYTVYFCPLAFPALCCSGSGIKLCLGKNTTQIIQAAFHHVEITFTWDETFCRVN